MKKLFSLFALAGAFVACQPEELETAFSVDNATVTIHVTVTDVQTGAAAEGVTISCSDGAAKVEGNEITLVGNPAFEKTTVTVTATSSKYAEPAEEDVEINELRAGAVADYNVVLVVGKPVSDYAITVEKDVKAETSKTEYVSGATYDHSHDGIEHWRRNDTRFFLDFKVDYYEYSGSEVAGEATILDPAFQSIVEPYVQVYNAGIKKTAKVAEARISAWCIYTATQTLTTQTVDYVVKADGVEVGRIPAVVPVSSEVEFYEMEDPESHGHGHYQPGHGHDDTHGHGAGNNAGGGIIFAE